MYRSGSETITIQKWGRPETAKDNKRIARTRRQRGYSWEGTLVKRFNSADGWSAFRLGSPSVALPDVLAVSTKESAILAIEAKSGTSMSLLVPADQIQRCQKWTETFGAYKNRRVVMAFKFLSKKRTGLGTYKSRQKREFFKVWDAPCEITDCVCTYDGITYVHRDGEKQGITLKDCKMPFKMRPG